MGRFFFCSVYIKTGVYMGMCYYFSKTYSVVLVRTTFNLKAVLSSTHNK